MSVERSSCWLRRRSIGQRQRLWLEKLKRWQQATAEPLWSLMPVNRACSCRGATELLLFEPRNEPFLGAQWRQPIISSHAGFIQSSQLPLCRLGFKLAVAAWYVRLCLNAMRQGPYRRSATLPLWRSISWLKVSSYPRLSITILLSVLRTVSLSYTLQLDLPFNLHAL